MIGDAHPVPNISDILDHLGTEQYFFIIDLASRFHQIELDPKDTQEIFIIKWAL